MQTSTPKAGKKGSHQKKQPDEDAGVSPVLKEQPTDSKTYSKRQRKPRKWEDFQLTKISGSSFAQDDCTVAIGNTETSTVDSIDPLQQLQAEQTSLLDIPTESPEKADLCQKRGRRRQDSFSKKTDLMDKGSSTDKSKRKKGKARKSKMIGQTEEDVRVDQSINDISDGKSDDVGEGSTDEFQTGDGNDSDLRVVADVNETERLRQAVESKRKTKYIEKKDRVIVRGNGTENLVQRTFVRNKTPKTKPASSEQEQDNAVNGFSSTEKVAESQNEGINVETDAECRDDSTVFKTPNTSNRGKKGLIKKDRSKDSSSFVDDSVGEKSGSKKGRRSKKSENKDVDEGNSDLLHPSRKGGRKRKQVDYASLEDLEIEASASTEGELLNVFKESSKRGRARKEVNYSALSDLDTDDVSLNTSSTTRKRGRPKNEVNYSTHGDDEEEATDKDLNKSGLSNGMKPGKKKGRPKKADRTVEWSDTDDSLCGDISSSGKGKCIKCHHCDFEAKGVPDIRKHYAVKHQMLWSKEHPEGESTSRALSQVIKLKGFLNCPKCDKQINFATYYPNHLEWCGREHLTYTCEHCLRDNLILRWKTLHLKTCPALVVKENRERQKEREQMKDESDGEIEPGKKRKRKAAKKAMQTVHDLSKDVDPLAEDDNSDNDPDVVIHEEDDDDDEDEYVDDEVEEESIGTPEEEEGDIVDFDADDNADVGDGGGGAAEVTRYVTGTQFFMTYRHMEEFVKKNWSKELFIHWMPLKKDWNILSDREAEKYLPKPKSSVRFCFEKKAEPQSLPLYESAVSNGLIFYTGLHIWRLAWCPMPMICKDDQFLAVTGKLDYNDAVLTDERQTGPSVIQIWNTGLNSNKMKSSSTPRLYYNLVQDFGFVTQMKWCPSGCYLSSAGQADDEVYARLGLVAASYTDGTCRIYSLPMLPDAEAPPTFKASPVLTLLPYLGHERDSFTCSSIDWFTGKGHAKIVAGYSDGAVRLFNLLSKSPIQLLSTNSGETLLPFRNFQPHGNLVRSVSWTGTVENMIVTCADNFELYFWDINNLGLPVYEDNGCHMTTNISSSVLQLGVFLVSDDNYAMFVNKGRYLDSGHMLYTVTRPTRKDERSNYYISSQPACIWEVTSSDWVGLVATCDNRGCAVGLLMRDHMKNYLDCKSYKYRQILMKTNILENSVQEPSTSGNSQNTSDKNQASQSKCAYCLANQSASGIHDMEPSESIDQSDSVCQKCTCDKKYKNKIKCAHNSAQDKHTSLATNKKEYHTLVKKSVLHFEENFKVSKYLTLDKNTDVYDKPSIAALKSMSLNPNCWQSCWLAYGGNPGLVRLVSVEKIVSRQTQAYMLSKKYV